METLTIDIKSVQHRLSDLEENDIFYTDKKRKNMYAYLGYEKDICKQHFMIEYYRVINLKTGKEYGFSPEHKVYTVWE